MTANRRAANATTYQQERADTTHPHVSLAGEGEIIMMEPGSLVRVKILSRDTDGLRRQTGMDFEGRRKHHLRRPRLARYPLS